MTASALPCRCASLPLRFPAAALLIASFALAVLTLFCLPAQASYWNVAITDNGGSNATFKGYSNPWTPPADGNNTNSFDLYAADTIEGSDDTQDDNASVTVNATITLTWVASPAGDPAPTSIDIVKSGYADAYAAGTGATASASDGISGDTCDPDAPETDQDGGTMETPDDLPAGGRLTKKSVSGGTLTFNRTLTASGSSSYSFTDSFSGTQNAEVSYTVSIHAQPYNFRRVGGTKWPSGEIDWVYAYSSTDGTLQDLTTCGWHEHLTYPGGPIGSQPIPNQYFPPSPPFGAPLSGYNNPTFTPDASLAPQMSGTTTIADSTLVPPFVEPYFYGTYTTTHVFEFDDSVTSDVNTQIPGPDSGPFNIVRTFSNLNSTNYQYTVSKASVTNTYTLPN